MKEHDCEACPLGDVVERGIARREFVRDLALGSVGVLSLLGVPKIALAMIGSGAPLTEVKPVAVNGPMRSYATPTSDGVGIDHDADIILVRWKDEAYAFDLSCPHQHTALRWDEAGSHFRCPKHKSEYEPTGTFIRGRATRGMDRYALRRDADRLTVDTSNRFQQNADPAGWSAALAKLS